MLRSVGNLLMLRAVPRQTLIVRNKYPAKELMKEEEVERTTRELSKILNCTQEVCRRMIRNNPRLRRKTLEEIVSVARKLRTCYDTDSIVRCGQILGQDWQTIQQRRFILEEIGLPYVGLTQLNVFPYIMDRTIIELKRKDKIIPQNLDVLSHVLSGIPGCPSSFIKRVVKILPPEITNGLPLINVWKTLVLEYLAHRMPNANSTYLERRHTKVFAQSLRELNRKLDVLENSLGFANGLVKFDFLFSADASNMQAITDRVKFLAGHPLEKIVHREPRILLANVEDVCKIESILQEQEVSSEQVWCCPYIYLFPPHILTKRFKETAESADSLLLRESYHFLNHVTENLELQTKLKNERLGKQIVSVVFNSICWRFALSDEEIPEVRKRLRTHKGNLHTKSPRIGAAVEVLSNEIGLSREQIIAAPLLLLQTKTALREGWKILNNQDHIQKIGCPDWKKSKLAGVMLLYELESDISLEFMEQDAEESTKPSISIHASTNVRLLTKHNEESGYSAFRHCLTHMPDYVEKPL